MKRRVRSSLVVTVIVTLGLVGSTGVAQAQTAQSVQKAKKASGTITVSAAASLTEAFTEMEADFQQANPDATVELNFAGSSALAQQIQGGAPADVFASANGLNMQKVVSGGEVTAEPTVFAANALTIVVKPGNPEDIEGLADLADVDVLSLCADEVPCGKYAQQAFSQAGVTIDPAKVTKGADVKATLSAVSNGDADAAVVYTTDAEAAGSNVESVRIPAWLNVYAIYPIAPIAASSNRDLAKTFIKYTVSPAGQQTLQKHGFLPPPIQ